MQKITKGYLRNLHQNMYIMSTRKIIGIILIVGSLALGYAGIDKIGNNDASIKILDLKIDVSNETAKQQGYMYLGLALVLFAGGIYTLNKVTEVSS